MPGSTVERSQVRRRLGVALPDAATVDEVARLVLDGLSSVQGVVGAQLALTEQGGRVLRFCSSAADGPRDGAVTWSQIDGLADVPLVRAILTGLPVLLADPAALRIRYPRLAAHHEQRGVRALAAVPLGRSRPGCGALLLSWGSPHDLATETDALLRVAGLVAGAVERVRSNGAGARRAGQHRRVVDLREPAGTGRTRQAVVTLTGGSTAPRTARRFLRERFLRWRLPPQTTDDAELCLSEIVTNAVIHSGTSTEVTVWLDEDRVRVVVRDGGGGVLVSRHAHQPDPGAVGGRGLLLVEHLAHTWSYEQNATGTTVSFEVLLPQPAVGASTVSAPATVSHSSGSGPSRSPSA